MAGHIRTLQKCPVCRGKFTRPELTCPTCQTRPTRFFIDLWWHSRLKIYTDPQGIILDSYARTEQLLSTIRHQAVMILYPLKKGYFIGKEINTGEPV